MTTKEIQEIRKASKDLLELSAKVRSETEVIQACIRTLDQIAHDVNTVAYDVGVSVADLSDDEDELSEANLKFVADHATGVSDLFMNRAIDFLAELGARFEVRGILTVSENGEMEVLAPRKEPEIVNHKNRVRLALHVLNNASYFLGDDRYEHLF